MNHHQYQQQHQPPPTQQQQQHFQQPPPPPTQQMVQQQHPQVPPAPYQQQQQQQQQQIVGQQHPTNHPHLVPHLPHLPHQNATQTPPSSVHMQHQQQPTKGKTTKKSLEDSVLVTRLPDEESVTGHIKNREAIQKIRDAWIFKQIRQRQPEFTQYRSVRLHVYFDATIPPTGINCIYSYGTIFISLSPGSLFRRHVECKCQGKRRILR